MTHDSVNHPEHYTSHPSGIECIEVTEHMGFNLGNAVKYIWRADLKNNAIEDLEKAVWYIQREIAKRKGKAEPMIVTATGKRLTQAEWTQCGEETRAMLNSPIGQTPFKGR